MFVAISRFTVEPEQVEPVREAFRRRPHRVDAAPGFVRLEVLSPAGEPGELWVVTRWTDQPSFERWHRSHAFHASHELMPEGLTLVPRSAELRTFEVIAE